MSTGTGTIQLGAMVNYKLREGQSAGEYRPAIITRTWGSDGKNPQTDGTQAVQLEIFLDGTNDAGAEKYASSALYNDNDCPPGTWVWPSVK